MSETLEVFRLNNIPHTQTACSQYKKIYEITVSTIINFQKPSWRELLLKKYINKC